MDVFSVPKVTRLTMVHISLGTLVSGLSVDDKGTVTF
jgi:hypothetical protein